MGLMMGAVRTSETSVNFFESTRRDIPAGCHHLTGRFENLKSNLPNVRMGDMWNNIFCGKPQWTL
jgi:hypothetical protein